MPIDLVNAGRRAVGRYVSDNLMNTAFRSAGTKVDPVSQPQLAYMWEVSFRGIFSSNARNITLYARSAGIPSINVEPIKRFYAGVEYGYSGKDNTPRVMRVTFWDNQNLDIYRYFLQWMNTMNDSSLRRKVRPMNYKRDISLKLKDTTDGITNAEIVFGDCFPTEISEVSLTYDESGAMQFDVQFHFDSRRTSGEILSSALGQGLNLIGAGNISNAASRAIEGFRGFF